VFTPLGLSFVFATPGAYGKSTTLTLIRMACLLKG
jgi:hypothetical protein